MLQTVEISLPELLERVRAGQIPMSARAQVTYDVPAPPEATPPAPGEGSTMTEAEMEEERRLFEQFERNVNETRLRHEDPLTWRASSCWTPSP